jgi:probable phosphoglycerate mutase
LIEPTHLFALRHGQTAYNATQRLQGHLDIGLDDTGRWQARRLGAALADAGILAVYSSDLVRARDTGAARAPLRRARRPELRRDRGAPP